MLFGETPGGVRKASPSNGAGATEQGREGKLRARLLSVMEVSRWDKQIL